MKSERNDLLAKRYYKEVSPSETIKKVKDKLTSLGFEIHEEELDSGIDTYSYALHLMLNGYRVSFSNGKGNTKEYSRASAYAEMLERLQTNPDQILKNFYQYVDKFAYKGKIKYGLYQDDKNIESIEEYINDNEFIEGMKKYKDFEDNYSLFLDFIKSQKEFYGFIPLQKYMKSDESEVKYLNESYYRYINGTTGLCAGNSKYEALTQGLSEIFERAIKWFAYKDKLTFPVIPENKLKCYEYAYSKIKEINKNDRFFIEVRDLSMGGKYPVVAVVIYDRMKRGRLVNVGSFPVFEIALNRALNELFQGQTLGDLTSMRSYLNYDLSPMSPNYSDKDLNEWVDSLRNNSGLYPEEFFSSKYDFKVSDWIEPQKELPSNEELFKKLCKIVNEDLNDEVYYKEYSFLDLPAYSIICPRVFDEICFGRGFYNQGRVSKSYTVDKKLYELIFDSNSLDLELIKSHINNNYKTERDLSLLLNYALPLPTISTNSTVSTIKACICIYEGKFKMASELLYKNFPKYYDCEPYEKFARLDYINILMNYLGLKGNPKFDSDEKVKACLYKMYNKEYVDDVVNLCSTPSKLINAMFVQRNHPLSLFDWDLYFTQVDAFNRIYREKEKGNIKI